MLELAFDKPWLGNTGSPAKLDDSDLDFVVEFQPEAFEAYVDAYFGLLEALGQLFRRPVDLVVGSAIKNPYLLQSVEQTRTAVYKA